MRQTVRLLFKFHVLVIGCLLIAFLLRVWGLDFGLPLKFHPDEDKYVDVALNWHLTSRFEAEFINPPLLIHVLSAGYALWLAFSPFVPSDSWLSATYFFGRFWSVGFSILTVALAFRLGKFLCNRQAGLVALILLSGSFLPAREAHFAVNDSLVTFLVLLAIYFCLMLLRQSRLSTYMMAALAIGLATSAKLTGGLTVLTLLLAHFFCKKVQRHLYLGLSLFVAFAVFLLVSVHVLWQIPLFLEAVSDHLKAGAGGYKGLQMAPMSGYFFYIYTLGWGIGWLMLGAILLAVVRLLPTREGLVLVVFSLALFFYMGSQKLVFARFLLPAVPPLIIAVAIELARLARRWSLPTWGWPVVLGLLLSQSLVNLFWFDHLLTLPDTRELATNWFISEFPENVSVARESYSILPSRVLVSREWPHDIENLSSSRQIRNGADHYLSPETQLVVISNYTFERVRLDPIEEEMRLAQLAELGEKATLIKVFDPYQSNYEGFFYLDQLYGPAAETWHRVRPGPLIEFYSVDTTEGN